MNAHVFVLDPPSWSAEDYCGFCGNPFETCDCPGIPTYEEVRDHPSQYLHAGAK